MTDFFDSPHYLLLQGPIHFHLIFLPVLIPVPILAYPDLGGEGVLSNFTQLSAFQTWPHSLSTTLWINIGSFSCPSPRDQKPWKSFNLASQEETNHEATV